MTINDKGAGDPTLEDEMRAVLRRMAAALIDEPDELQRRYDEIDAIIAKLDAPSAVGQEIPDPLAPQPGEETEARRKD